MINRVKQFPVGKRGMGLGHLVAWRLENDSPVRAQMVTVVTALYSSVGHLAILS